MSQKQLQEGGSMCNAHLSTNKSTQGERGELASVDAILIDVPHIQLHWCMILRCNQPVGWWTATIATKDMVTISPSIFPTQPRQLQPKTATRAKEKSQEIQ